MTFSERHMEMSGRKVISHFKFQPPLIAAASLEGHGCFIFPVNTSGDLYRSGGKVSVKSDQGVLMKCGAYVNKWSAANKEQHAEVVILRLYPEIINEVIDPGLLISKKTISSSLASMNLIQIDQFMRKYMESLFFYFDHPDLVDDKLVELKLTELVMMIMKLPQSEELSNLVINLFKEEQTNIRQVVETHLYEELSVDELAQLSSMSLATFKRKFKEVFGSSPGKYIRDRRMEKARMLLSAQTCSISEIAYSLGYSDPNYFSKVFMAHSGYSPSNFRSYFSQH
ncbi:MAG: AraC family transcriptional regulator [Cytophagales bacterium]|nr:AraC family transcriptional regulator [Cytophagales bacterium]